MTPITTQTSPHSPNEEISHERIPERDALKRKAEKFSCPNENCAMHGIIGAGNITFREKYSAGATQNLFKCNACGRTFSERRDTPLFGLRLPEEKIWGIIRCILEGNGTRATARIMQVHRDSVTKLIRLFGLHSEQVSAAFLKDYPLKECQLDELWTFIKKNRRT